MEPEHDYKKAYETLLQAVKEADRILRNAKLRVFLQMEREAGRLGPEDEELDRNDQA